jgi:ribosomal protein S17
MDRTVRVCHRHNTYDRHIGKYYPKETHYLVSDPRNSLRDGDVIEFSSGAPKSKHVHHVVERIITPFGAAISERPAVLSRAERDAEREARWAEKYVRREGRILGREIDLRTEAMEMAAKRGEAEKVDFEGLSTAQLIREYHGGEQRVGKIKKLVKERMAME